MRRANASRAVDCGKKCAAKAHELYRVEIRRAIPTVTKQFEAGTAAMPKSAVMPAEAAPPKISRTGTDGGGPLRDDDRQRRAIIDLEAISGGPCQGEERGFIPRKQRAWSCAGTILVLDSWSRAGDLRSEMP